MSGFFSFPDGGSEDLTHIGNGVVLITTVSLALLIFRPTKTFSIFSFYELRLKIRAKSLEKNQWLLNGT